MKAKRLLIALALALTLTACSADESDSHPDGPGKVDDRSKTSQPTEENPPPEDVEPPADAEPPEAAAMSYDEAYDYLETLIQPSEALLGQFDAADGAEDWASLRSLGAQLADSLRTLQRGLEAGSWPPETQAVVDRFVVGLEDEISWYSYVSISATDQETSDALDQPWNDAAVDASSVLWDMLDAGL